MLAWRPLAGGFLAGKYRRDNPPPAGSRFADAGQFVPFDKEMGYRVVEVLKEVAARHGASPARVALSRIGSRRSVSEVDGPSTRHRGRPAFQSSVSRALR